MQDADGAEKESYAREVRIRDLYAARLQELRPNEKLIKTEYIFIGARARADMRTLDSSEVLRIWEFKIIADYSGLGQALTYLALTRHESRHSRTVKGVLAAFEIPDEIRLTNEVLNLGLELVLIPQTLRHAGGILPSTHFEFAMPPAPLPNIPIRLEQQTETASEEPS